MEIFIKLKEVNLIIQLQMKPLQEMKIGLLDTDYDTWRVVEQEKHYGY